MNKKIEYSYVRTFNTTDGQKVLQHLRELTVERFLGPDATDNQLRHLEGQRALVRQIETIIERGRSPDIAWTRVPRAADNSGDDKQ
jgi:hypothetical protein